MKLKEAPTINKSWNDYHYHITEHNHQLQKSLFGCMQVIVVTSERETDGFLAPSITILPREGWKGNATLEKCS